MGVLVAISIPIFTSQLEKSRDSVSISNIRAAYAESQAAILTFTDALDGVAQNGVTVSKVAAGGYTVAVTNVAIKTQQGNDWSGLDVELPWNVGKTAADRFPQDGGAVNNTATVTFTYDGDLNITNVAY